MKTVGSIMAAAGLLIFFGLFFITVGKDTYWAVVPIVGGVLAIIGLYVRGRAVERVGIFKITEKDRAQLKKARNIWSPRNLLGEFVGRFAWLFLFVGFVFPIYEAGHKFNWGMMLGCFAFGCYLMFCSVLLLNPKILQNRPPYWLPRISGSISGALVLILAAGIFIARNNRSLAKSSWFPSLCMVIVIAAILSAIICLVSGLSALCYGLIVRRKPRGLF